MHALSTRRCARPVGHASPAQRAHDLVCILLGSTCARASSRAFGPLFRSGCVAGDARSGGPHKVARIFCPSMQASRSLCAGSLRCMDAGMQGLLRRRLRCMECPLLPCDVTPAGGAGSARARAHLVHPPVHKLLEADEPIAGRVQDLHRLLLLVLREVEALLPAARPRPGSRAASARAGARSSRAY
jgi:hypothetical protein